MPHVGDEAVRSAAGTVSNGNGETTESPTIAFRDERKGADLLMSLAETASEHAPQHTHLYPAQPPPPPPHAGYNRHSNAVTPSPMFAGQRPGGMHMSVHGQGTHRLLPSPIKLHNEESSQLVDSSSSEPEHSSQLCTNGGTKRKAEHYDHDEAPATKAVCSESPSERSSPNEPQSEELPDPKYASNVVISPTSSNESNKPPPEEAPRMIHPPPSVYRPVSHPAPFGYMGQPWMPPPVAYYAAPVPTYHHPPHYHHHHHYPAHVVHPRPPVYPNTVVQSRTQPTSRTPRRQPDEAVSTKHAEAQAETIKSMDEWQRRSSSSGSKARCIPLEHPIRAKKPTQGSGLDHEIKLPDFPMLVNFPEHLTRGQTRGTGENKGLAPEGKRHCVMCGQLRICSSSSNRLNRSTAPTAESDSTVHIIPRQNKGVCTACDVTVWKVVDDEDGLEIKWCKGCKNFRPWPAFGDKGLATKCARCRHRQREKYAMQKKKDAYDVKDDMLAAQGLSNLMKAQNA